MWSGIEYVVDRKEYREFTPGKVQRESERAEELRKRKDALTPPNNTTVKKSKEDEMGGKESEDLIFKFTLNLHNIEPLLAGMAPEKNYINAPFDYHVILLLLCNMKNIGGDITIKVLLYQF